MAETVSDARLVDFATATNYVDVSVAEVIAMAAELQSRRAAPDRAAIVEECARVADCYLNSPDHSVRMCARWIAEDMRAIAGEEKNHG